MSLLHGRAHAHESVYTIQSTQNVSGHRSHNHDGKNPSFDPTPKSRLKSYVQWWNEMNYTIDNIIDVRSELNAKQCTSINALWILKVGLTERAEEELVHTCAGDAVDVACIRTTATTSKTRRINKYLIWQFPVKCRLINDENSAMMRRNCTRRWLVRFIYFAGEWTDSFSSFFTLTATRKY